MQFHRLSPKDLPQTDTRLLSAAGQQDQEAWRQLMFLYAPVIRFWIYQDGVRDSSDIEDILQDVCFSVSKGLPKFRREEGIAKFRAWLKTISRNKVIDYFRKREKQPQGQGGTTVMQRMQSVEEVLDDESQLMANDEDAEETILMSRAIYIIRQEFQESSWKAFEKTVIEGLSATEAAEQLQSTSAAVRKAKSRVLNRLRQLLATTDLSFSK